MTAYEMRIRDGSSYVCSSDLDDVIADEGRALARALRGMLERASPPEHRPTRIIIGRHLREDRTEIDLPVAERTEASGPIDPALIPAIDAGPAVGPEFGILDVKADRKSVV